MLKGVDEKAIEAVLLANSDQWYRVLEESMRFINDSEVIFKTRLDEIWNSEIAVSVKDIVAVQLNSKQSRE